MAPPTVLSLTSQLFAKRQRRKVTSESPEVDYSEASSEVYENEEDSLLPENIEEPPTEASSQGEDEDSVEDDGKADPQMDF